MGDFMKFVFEVAKGAVKAAIGVTVVGTFMVGMTLTDINFYMPLHINEFYQNKFRELGIKTKGFIKYNKQPLKVAIVFRNLQIAENLEIIKNSMIFHVGLCIDDTVYHITGEPPVKTSKMITQSIYDFYGESEDCYCIPIKLNVKQLKEVRDRLNKYQEQEYDLFSNNCEHWTTYMLLGEKLCSQTEAFIESMHRVRKRPRMPNIVELESKLRLMTKSKERKCEKSGEGFLPVTFTEFISNQTN